MPSPLRTLALAGAVLAGAASAQPVPLDSLARAVADSLGLPSLVVGITVGGERAVVGVGEVHGERPNAHTLYEIGSVSKVLTGLALADAVVRRETTLETPIADLLADSVTVGAHEAGPIRLVDLATHTAGLPQIDLAMGFAPGFDMSDPYARYDADDLMAFLDRIEPATPPGETYAYSNAGAGLLGFALARRAGTPYAEHVQARVLDPLGLGETFVTVPDALADRLAPGHAASGEPTPPWTFQEPTVAAGGWRASAADLLTLAEAAIRPEGTPLADAIALSLTPHAATGDGREVGLGWHLSTLDGGLRVASHNGGTGGFVTSLLVAPDEGLGVVVLSSRMVGAPLPLFALDLLHRLARAE